MRKAVFGLINSEKQANHIVDSLLSSGFTNEDISILCPDNSNKAKNRDWGRDSEWGSVENRDVYKKENVKKGISTEKNTKAPEGGVTGATAGGILGGTLGLLAGIGALAIPGLGPFIAAGPLLAALSGSAVGGSLGLLVGSLVGAGIPEYEAKKYETGLKEGNILISVNADSDSEIQQAKEILKREGARDISTTNEKAKSY